MLDAAFIEAQQNVLLFETVRCDRENYKSYLFVDPQQIIVAQHVGQIPQAFNDIERYARDRFLAGFFSYELGYYFEQESFMQSVKMDSDLLRLGVFDKALVFNHRTGRPSGHAPFPFARAQRRSDFTINRLVFNFRQDEYCKKISRIKEYIRKGDTYQVNFTGRFTFAFRGSPLALYEDLKARQRVAYAAFCKLGNQYIISLSPELYFKKDKDRLYARPMKGTIGRGVNTEEDALRAQELRLNPKAQAENLMIVDLMRNDLGRICRKGSVAATSLFDIEKYETLFQMTSTVKGVLKKNTTYRDIFSHMFPGGSVTGAPKIRTMQIIRQLEKAPRGVYCGALGFIAPGRKAVFNMPIRTLVIEDNHGAMGVGSGIVIDSSPHDEYRECLLKARFLTDRFQPFQLIETMLWDNRFVFLHEHLRRMQYSARYFDFCFDRTVLLKKCLLLEKRLSAGKQYRLRVLLRKDGEVTVNVSALEKEKTAGIKRVAVSRIRTQPDSVFWYHKTTHRALYDAEYNRYRAKGYHDVIFLNTRGQITEGAISNVIIEKRSQRFTPPVSCGLLPGVFRAHLIKKGLVREKQLSLDDLIHADALFLCNSVRGLTRVVLTTRRV